MGKCVSVVNESEDSRTLSFRDNGTGCVISRAEFVKKIENGTYPAYHVRKLKSNIYY